MSHRILAAAVVLLAGCTAAPIPTPLASSQPSDVLDCGGVTPDTCREVADAARLMLGTAPLGVEELELPDEEDGLRMVERYLVRLEPDAAGDELVEVVRFAGSDNWSARRAPAETQGN